MVEGNYLAELHAQIHALAINTGLFSWALCLCLLVIPAVYSNNYMSETLIWSVVKSLRDLNILLILSVVCS